MRDTPSRRTWVPLLAGMALAASVHALVAQTPGGAPPAPAASPSIPQPFLALTHANVVDIRTGRIAANATAVLKDGRIVSVGAAPAPAGATAIDLNGKYVLLGLMDAHTHLDNLDAARRALESGVTTVRSASVGSYRDVALREMAKNGYIAGPDVLAAGVFVSPNLTDTILADPALGKLIGGVRTLDALREVVKVNLAHGVDVVKTRGTERAGLPNTDPREQTYTEEQLRAVVQEAAAKDVPVLAHAHGDEGALAAVKAGVRSIEHGTYMSDATLTLMKQKGTYFVPTYSTVVDLIEPGGDYDNAVLHVRGLHMLPRLRRTVQHAHAMGVKIVTGGDTAYGPESVTRIAHEIMNLAEIGLSKLEALQAATITAAELLRIEKKTGAIESGLEADVIVVEDNPLEDLGTVRDMLLVVSNGRIALNRLSFGSRGASQQPQ